jgi:hypothetical protein
MKRVGIYLLGDQEVRLAWHPTVPFKAFICPSCQKLRYKLYCVRDSWACWRCHGLTHASRHICRSIPRWHRLQLLRRKIGASNVPFSPIEPRPKSQRNYRKIVVELRAIEAGLCGHTSTRVSAALERRK